MDLLIDTNVSLNASTLLGPKDPVEKRNVGEHPVDILHLQTVQVNVYLSCCNDKSAPSREFSLRLVVLGGCSSL